MLLDVPHLQSWRWIIKLTLAWNVTRILLNFSFFKIQMCFSYVDRWWSRHQIYSTIEHFAVCGNDPSIVVSILLHLSHKSRQKEERINVYCGAIWYFLIHLRHHYSDCFCFDGASNVLIASATLCMHILVNLLSWKGTYLVLIL